MNVKIDTKDKFTEITAEESNLTANMAEAFNNLLISYLDKDVPHIILNAEYIKRIDTNLITVLTTIKEKFMEADASFVICCLQPDVQKQFDDLELIDFLNVTPTLSEAWDIVQMEEIERELLNGLD